jgi:IS30 family transposase
MRISHEAIYQALYIQGRGALKRELSACLRSGRALRLPRERARNRGKSFITDALMISDRPTEIDDSEAHTSRISYKVSRPQA